MANLNTLYFSISMFQGRNNPPPRTGAGFLTPPQTGNGFIVTVLN
jgi:hypothetical protein